MIKYLTLKWISLKHYLIFLWTEIKVDIRIFYERLLKSQPLNHQSTFTKRTELHELSDLEKAHLDMDETHSFMDRWPAYFDNKKQKNEVLKLQFEGFGETGVGTAIYQKNGHELKYYVNEDTASAEPLWTLWPGQWFKGQVEGHFVINIISKEKIPIAGDEECYPWYALSYWNVFERTAAAKRRLLNGMPEATVRLIYGHAATDEAVKELKTGSSNL